MITWDSSLSVGVSEIDVQHQKLIKMLNELQDAMKQGKSKEVLSGIVSGMITYAGTHFAFEEKYFAQFKYPETAAHKAEHVAFATKVKDFQTKFNEGKTGISIEVLNFLSDWLTKHIKGTDKKYGPFFNANGLK